jgi:type IV pilus biogenesis protein CpaD/CtpE
MTPTRVIAVAVLALALAGCASNPPRPVKSLFEDIPVAKGMSYQAGDSTVIETPTVQAAREVYRGRIELESLATATRTTLEANGWRHVSSTTVSKHGTTQVFEKAGSSLEVHLWEGWWYTYVELTASRASQPPK